MKKYAFAATIERGPGGGAFIKFPYDVQKEFGTKGRVPVQASINKVPYTGSLMACGGQYHMLGVLKAIREQLGKQIGDEVRVEILKDNAVRTVETPADLATLLKREKLLAVFEKLSYTHRKEYVRWITDAKKAETRAARLTKAVAMLHKGVKTPD